MTAEDVDPSLVRSLEVLSDLADDDVIRVAAIARTLSVPEGAVVVREWDVTRDFFVVLDGAVRVARNGAPVATLGAGDFFGELAARDWGRGLRVPTDGDGHCGRPTSSCSCSPRERSRP